MRRLLLSSLLLSALGFASPVSAQPRFEVHEASIADIHAAMTAGRLTCRTLVEAYLARIAAFDKNGPALNAIVVTNAEALNRPTIWTGGSRRVASRGRSTACP